MVGNPRLTALQWRRCFRLLFAGPALGALLILLAPSAAVSQTCNASMQNVVFGDVDTSSGAAVDTASTLSLTCSGFNGGGARLCISIDKGSAGDAVSRQMIGPGGALLRYDLYKDSARSQVWGTRTAGAHLLLDVSNGTPTNVTVYGRLFGSQQSAPSGSYSSSFSSPLIEYRNLAGSGASSDCTPVIGTTQTTFAATATVLPTCTISATNMDFGSFGVLTASRDASSTLSLTCVSGTSYTISLDGGNASASDPANRKMSKGFEQITYGLYQDSARTQLWGSTIGANTRSGTGTGSAQSISVYGRVPAQPTPSPGSYSDTIVATVTY